MKRDHHLRDRRLALGLTQGEMALHASLSGGSAQTYVSQAERGLAPRHVVQKIRSALVWLESEPRRVRELARLDARLVAAVNAPATPGTALPSTAVLCLGESIPVCVVDARAAGDQLIRRLADLLHDGDGEAFDVLAAQVPDSFGLVAGNLYLDESCPAPGIARPETLP